LGPSTWGRLDQFRRRLVEGTRAGLARKNHTKSAATRLLRAR
jgi:uncharacterized small protein (DUF1192 family)